MSRRLAVIDFGTNTARLLIADRADDGSFEQVSIQREIVRLGGGFCRTGGLSMDAMRRGLECLGRFSVLISDYAVSHVLAVATSAVRDATNGAAFVESVRRKTGIDLKVIDGITEGTLTLAGVMAGLDQDYAELLMLDIGGGSTEFTLARSGRVAYVHSLPLGVVRLTEGKGNITDMRTKIDKELDRLVRDMRQSESYPRRGIPLVATAGTATTLAAISMKMENYDYRRINNAIISKDEITIIHDRLLPMTPEERLSVPGLEKGREDLIMAGMLITLRAMELFELQVMKVSDYGLLEGLVVCGESVVNKYEA